MTNTTTDPVELAIEPINPVFGAYLRIRPEDTLAPGMPEKIMAALERYSAVVFPQINMSDELFAKLTAALGEQHELGLTKDKSQAAESGIYRISLDKDDKTQLDVVRGNDYWHMDGTAYDRPGKATLLKCETPPAEGGDTGLASLYAAYDALPDSRKQELEGLRVVHCLEAVCLRFYDNPTERDYKRWNAVFPRREHPLVWHQQNGRTALLIGSTAEHIVGMDADKSRQLLDELYEWATQDRFTYRHKWQKGDLLIFDNPTVMHRSFPYNEAAGRVMHRTTLKGTEAIA